MTQYFNDKGVKAVAVHSSASDSENTLKRDEAINGLESGSIDVIFCVDIFNEGVDIPSLDTVLFLRPTESYVVFLQQLGRGLRKDNGKKYLTVIDFIGNYKRAHYLPKLLAGENPMEDTGKKTPRIDEIEIPDYCHVNFDLQLIELFEELRKRDPLKQRMKDEYFRLKKQLGRRPLRIDIYQGVDIKMREYLKQGYLRFLDSIDELNETEKSWLGTMAEDLLKELEKTSMTKSYKIPNASSFC